MKKIIFIAPNFSPFVEKDYITLKKKAYVKEFIYNPQKQLNKIVREIARLFVFLIKNIRKSDIIYCWFADYHSFFPMLFAKIFNKQAVIIVGGYDAVSIPEINYGVFNKKGILPILVKLSYKMSTLILPVDKSLIEGTNYYANKKGIKTGVKHFVKNLKATIVEVPTGYDSSKWIKKEEIHKNQTVITIASTKNMVTYKLKGLNLFIELAKKMQDKEFLIIGVSLKIQNYIKSKNIKNLKVYAFVENNQLVNYLAKSKVYCQFSLSEGLPNVLCEAMLCECVPVGSSANGIPKGIGEAGFVLEEQNVDKAVELVKKALASSDDLGKKARQHIINNFSHEKREQSLYKLLNLQ